MSLTVPHEHLHLHWLMFDRVPWVCWREGEGPRTVHSPNFLPVRMVLWRAMSGELDVRHHSPSDLISQSVCEFFVVVFDG